MVTLHNAFESYDLDSSGDLTFEEFAAALAAHKLTNQEIRSLFVAFDEDGSGAVDYGEFVRGIRGDLNPARTQLLTRLFDHMDSDGDGVITAADIGRNFVPKKHPDVLSGAMSAVQISSQFIQTWNSHPLIIAPSKFHRSAGCPPW